MSHGYEVEIGDYVDGVLPPAQSAALETHLAGCDTCRALVADFRTMRAAAAALEPHAPPAHVWARVAADFETTALRPAARQAWWSFGLTWRSAVAATVIVALLGSGAWFSWREVASRQRPTGQTASTTPGGASSTDAVGVMRSQISSIEPIVKSGSSVLPSETRAAYQAGIDDIDSALDRPRAVLATEPTNEQAQQSLFELLQSKLTLLQEMIALINEMRKGNQEEAARIVSGIEQ